MDNVELEGKLLLEIFVSIEKYTVFREQQAKREVLIDIEKAFENLICVDNYEKYLNKWIELKKKHNLGEDEE